MNVFIIGGGAAGMLSAIYAAKSGATVTILERNEKLGKKLYITGKGRCNITNLDTYEEYFKSIISNPKFISGALRLMPPNSVLKLLQDYGLDTKVERGNRAFPASNKSSDVISTLTKALKENDIKVVYNEKVLDFEETNGKITKIICENNTYLPDKVILATGGMSYSITGSDGSGYGLAKRLGHTIVPLRPSLVPIISTHCFEANAQTQMIDKLPPLQGLSLKNVEAKIVGSDGKVIFREFGEMIFTHNGLSGPIILSLSSRINRMDLQFLKISIDLKPALDSNTLDKRLLREIEEKRNKFFKNSMGDLLPSKLIPFIIRLSNIDEDTPMNSITKLQRLSLVELLKSLSFNIHSLADINDAIITAGGIATKEINPKTMQSKLVENLYFAGEIIDIDALTGGYNLQLAFSTGCAAGTYIL